MKITPMKRRLNYVVIISIVVILLVFAGAAYFYYNKQNKKSDSGKKSEEFVFVEKEDSKNSTNSQFNKSKSPTPTDQTLRPGKPTISDSQRTPGSAEASTPQVIISSFNTRSSVGKIDYNATINGAVANQSCTITAVNSVGENFSINTKSKDIGCSGSISSAKFIKDSSWTLTLVYKTATNEYVSRKNLKI